MKIYKANRKGIINYLLIGIIALPFLVFFLSKDTFIENPFILLPLVSPIVLVLWTYIDTSYKIQDGKLFYRSGFLRGIIDISAIIEIGKGKTMWSGIKPALAQKGLTIRYNSYDEIYIAPLSNEEMIVDFLKINADIVVTEKQLSYPES